MTKHATIARIRRNFPTELQQLEQWVTWRLETRPGQAKPTKVPYSVRGYRAASDNPATWATFDAACSAYLNDNYNGVGFMFSEHDPYVGVDFDHCVTDGAITDGAAGQLRRVLAVGRRCSRYREGPDTRPGAQRPKAGYRDVRPVTFFLLSPATTYQARPPQSMSARRLSPNCTVRFSRLCNPKQRQRPAAAQFLKMTRSFYGACLPAATGQQLKPFGGVTWAITPAEAKPT